MNPFCLALGDQITSEDGPYDGSRDLHMPCSIFAVRAVVPAGSRVLEELEIIIVADWRHVPRHRGKEMPAGD